MQDTSSGRRATSGRCRRPQRLFRRGVEQVRVVQIESHAERLVDLESRGRLHAGDAGSRARVEVEIGFRAHRFDHSNREPGRVLRRRGSRSLRIARFRDR